MGATWKTMSGPRGTSLYARRSATCHMFIGPIVCRLLMPYLATYLPCQRRTLPHVSIRACHVSLYGRAMCHHCKGDTCQSLIGPPVPTTSSICMPSHPTTCHL
jgi:hypothetical protein